METEILFEEVQTFAPKSVQQALKWMTGLLVFASLFSLFNTSHRQSEIIGSLFVGAVVCALAGIALTKIKLVTQVRTDGIYVRFSPLLAGTTIYRWESIDKLVIRSYNPILEYGGWGMRFSSNGRAFNTSGTTGLQIYFKDGKKLLIGTQQPDILRKALEKVSRYS